MTGFLLFVLVVAIVVLFVRLIDLNQRSELLEENVRYLRRQLERLSAPAATPQANADPRPEPQPAPQDQTTPEPRVDIHPEPAPAPEPVVVQTPPQPIGVEQPPITEPIAAFASTEPEPEPEASSAQPRALSTPSFDWEGLVGVKLFSWIAGIALVLAAVLFLKYSVEHGWLSPAVRAAMGLITGVGLLAVCELRVARNYRVTANALDAAGIAILYATLFAMQALWHLIPQPAAFGLMLVVTAVAVLLSTRRDSVFIALLGLVGGFATPALLSTGENRPVGLFGYLLLLNVGLAWVAYRKRWPVLTAASVVLTAIYQWLWIGQFLSASQLPLAAGIFVLFGLVAASALWATRGSAHQELFDRIAIGGAALPLVFALFTAAIPQYGARTNVLFVYLLVMAGGLAAIAWLHGPHWLHTLGGAATVATFALWLANSYRPAAWPTVLAWLSLFILFYLAVAMREDFGASAYTAAALFFVFPVLAAIEPRTASPALLFGVAFVLLGATAAWAIRFGRGFAYFAAAGCAIAAETLWSAKYLTPDRLLPALAVYGLFALAFIAVPAVARRAGRELRPRGGVIYLGVVGHALLLFVAFQPPLASPPWPLLAVLFILDLAVGLAALYLEHARLFTAAIVASDVVALAWAMSNRSAPWPAVAMGVTLGLAALALAWLALAVRRSVEGSNAPALASLILGQLFVAVISGEARSPLFTTMLATHALLLGATLAVAARQELHELAIHSVFLATLATALSRASSPAEWLIFAGAVYAMFLAYPLALGRRVKASLYPHLAAVLASVPFFFFARRAIRDAGYGSVIGFLPTFQAALLLFLLWRLLKQEDLAERMMARLALVAGASLAFITVAVPLQLDKEWITIGWALEAAALVWLFRRIPHRGLLYWSGGLSAAVFVRLIFNDAVFSYHPRSATAILNWFLYTYGVAAAAFFVAAWLLPAVERTFRAALNAGATVLLFVLVNIEIADFYARGDTLTFNFFNATLAQGLTYTIAWALFAIALLVAGIALGKRSARIAAIALLSVTILKCFLHDLARLGGLYRVGSLLGLALSLVLVGVLLQKFVRMQRPSAEAQPAP